MALHIDESCNLPMTAGVIIVDTKNAPVSICFDFVPKNTADTLTIYKLSSDKNPVIVYSKEGLLKDSDAIIFGKPDADDVMNATKKGIILKSNGKTWYLVEEIDIPPKY